MFSTFLYVLLLVLTLVSVWSIYKKRKDKNKLSIRARIIKIILFTITIGIWLYQIAIWLLPNGNFLHETLRLPHHYIEIKRASIGNMEEERYPYGKQSNQYLLYFEPKNKEITQERIVYFIHGGGWHIGSPELYRPAAQFFTERGYAVIMPAYRLAPKYGYQAIRKDLNLAMRKALNVLEWKKLHHRNIILIGDSAGGHLAALLLYDRKNLKNIGIDQSKFDCFISLAGALNLDKMSHSVAVRRFVGSPMDSTFHVANPFNYIQENEETPVLCIHGTCDGYVNYNASKSFVKKLNQIRPNLAQMATLDDATHLEVVGKWIYEENDTRLFLERWLSKFEKVIQN
jgi:alpha-beta hydrolase superfamily lysophospholipase